MMSEQLMIFLREWEGEVFYTVTGLPFTYELRQRGLYISRVRDDGEHTFTYENLQNALSLMPVDTVSGLAEVTGPSYCFAILKVFEKAMRFANAVAQHKASFDAATGSEPNVSF